MKARHSSYSFSKSLAYALLFLQLSSHASQNVKLSLAPKIPESKTKKHGLITPLECTTKQITTEEERKRNLYSRNYFMSYQFSCSRHNHIFLIKVVQMLIRNILFFIIIICNIRSYLLISHEKSQKILCKCKQECSIILTSSCKPVFTQLPKTS